MKDIEKKVIGGVTHVRLRCARCSGLVWIAYAKRIMEVRCSDCLPDELNDSIDHGDMGYGTNGGRLVDRRKGQS